LDVAEKWRIARAVDDPLRLHNQRAQGVSLRLLDGYQGYLMTDGYAGFTDLASAPTFAVLAAAMIVRGIDEYAFVRSGGKCFLPRWMPRDTVNTGEIARARRGLAGTALAGGGSDGACQALFTHSLRFTGLGSGGAISPVAAIQTDEAAEPRRRRRLEA
jgi:hypothetical protein